MDYKTIINYQDFHYLPHLLTTNVHLKITNYLTNFKAVIAVFTKNAVISIKIFCSLLIDSIYLYPNLINILLYFFAMFCFVIITIINFKIGTIIAKAWLLNSIILIIFIIFANYFIIIVIVINNLLNNYCIIIVINYFLNYHFHQNY